MIELTQQDRRLLAALKQDGRASVTRLAQMVGQSRATVQARMDRLLAAGAIERFTIDLNPALDVELIRAVMMIELEGVMTRSVTRTLKHMSAIKSLHSTNGTWDLVAHIETTNLPEFDRVLREVREIKGVLNSETSLLLNSVSGT
ncbi:MAG: Lrp/AsnC family transcriptional regulator [Rhizobiaceae bacterium]